MAVITGTSGDDVLRGTLAADTISGGAGYDEIYELPAGTLTGSGGDDSIDGGEGPSDRLRYDGVAAGVAVDLSITTIQDTGGAGLDVIVNIEGLIGTSFDDVFFGDDFSNQFSGQSGHDRLVGRAGNDILVGGFGDDTLEGGSGNDYLNGETGADDEIDTASYEDSTSRVVVELKTQTVGIDGSELDTLAGIEGVIGSRFSDVLKGTATRNELAGGFGSDALHGYEDSDLLDGGGGRDTLLGSSGDDTLIGGLGADTLTGGDDIDQFVYAALADSAKGSADIITDFERFVDRLDLSAIDADTTLDGDHAFTVVDSFSGAAGELILRARPAGGSLRADVDGDGAADLIVRFNGAFAIPLETDIVL